MAKTLCKWKKKEIEHRLKELATLVGEPKFVCKSCARAAHKKEHLCKAIKLA